MSADRALPPANRGVAARRMTEAAVQGRFELPHCDECGAVQYPPRERCVQCLSGNLSWKEAAPLATLLARTAILHSNEPYFRTRLPLTIGSARLDAGPVLIVLIEGADLEPGERVRVVARLDATQQAILVAVPY
jgi:uncharacterized OB-fold protein